MNSIYPRNRSVEVLDNTGRLVHTLDLEAPTRSHLFTRHHQLFKPREAVRLHPALLRTIQLHGLPDHVSDANAAAWAGDVMSFLDDFCIPCPSGYLSEYLPHVGPSDGALESQLATLMSEALTFPTVQHIRNFADNVDTGYRTSIYVILQKLYTIAEAWRVDEIQWGLFTSAPDWEGRKNPPSYENPERALHYLIRFVYGMVTTEGNQRANKYSRALSPLFNAHVPAASLIAQIEARGGLEAMSRHRPEDFDAAPPDDNAAGPLDHTTDREVSSSISHGHRRDEEGPFLATSMAVPRHLIDKLSSLIGRNAVAEISVDGSVGLGIQIKLIEVSG